MAGAEDRPGAGARVMIVEDDRTVRVVVGDYLRGRGYAISQFADGTAARQALKTFQPDLVVLDRMLPGVSGDELLREIRGASEVPIVMLTALDSASARIDGLERGADDYVAKPFALRELELRIAAQLRHRRESASPLAPFAVGPFRIDPALRRVTLDGRDVALSGREYDLFLFLLKHPDEVIPRDRIFREVWGWDVGEASTVTVHVRRLREKVERDPRNPEFLQTVWGAGYRFSVGAA